MKPGHTDQSAGYWVKVKGIPWFNPPPIVSKYFNIWNLFEEKNAFILTVLIRQQSAIGAHVFLYWIRASSFSSRGWSIWCLRRRGELRTCSALWFSSVSYARKRKRRAALCPACLTGCWRPCRAGRPPRTANRHARALVRSHSWHAPNCSPHPVSSHQVSPTASWKHKCDQHTWEIHTVMFCFWFFLSCSQPWKDQSPFNESMFLFSPLEWDTS